MYVSMTFGYPKMYLYVFFDIQKRIMDIQKSICGYPKIHFWISKKKWISIIFL